MAFSKLYNYVLDMVSTLPSKAAFLENRVVPATIQDQHYNDKCIFCWDKYSVEHPAAKFLLCGHVFGQTCVSQMVEGPTGDLCPFCRAQLFRRDVSLGVVASLLMNLTVTVFYAYLSLSGRLKSFIRSTHKTLLPLPLRRMLCCIYEGPQLWAITLVHHCTGVSSRNPNLRMYEAFIGTELWQIFRTGIDFAPLLWLVYYSVGFRGFKVVWFLLEMVFAYGSQYTARRLSINGNFDEPADRVMIERLVDATLVVKMIIIVAVLCSWSEPSLSWFGPAWNILGSVLWR